MDFQTLTLGGNELKLPANNSNANYSVRYEIVKGRQASTLAGGIVECGVVRKKVWTITFLSSGVKDNILSLVNSTSTFVADDGESYSVYVLDPVSFSPFPFSEIATMTIQLREA